MLINILNPEVIMNQSHKLNSRNSIHREVFIVRSEWGRGMLLVNTHMIHFRVNNT